MDASYILPYIESTKNVFQTMLHMQVRAGKPKVESAIPSESCDVSGIIGMSGDVVGVTILRFPLQTAKAIVTRFVGMEMPEDSEDFGDAIGELVNMVTGGAKAKFEGKAVSISCPSVIIGAHHKVQQMSDATPISIPCDCECGKFTVDVSIKESEERDSSQSSGAASGLVRGQ